MAGQLLAPEAREPRRHALRWRYVTCCIMFCVSLIANADRTNIGIVLAHGDLPGMDKRHKGRIFSAYFVGYICTQILGGVLARRYGAKLTMLLAVASWTFCDVLTPFVAPYGLASLLLLRAGIGLGEGMLYPSQQSSSAFWVPEGERAFLIVFQLSGQDIGSVLSNLISPHLLKAGTWCVFAAWGAAALLWVLAYACLGASAPECHGPCVRSGEADYIQAHRGAANFEVARKQCDSPFPRRILREPSVWAIFVGHVGETWAWYVLLSWMPTFFRGKHGLDLAANPALLCSPYLVGWVGGLAAGCISDALVARGFRTRRVRKLMQASGAVSTALLVQCAVRAESATAAAAWLSCATACLKMQNAGYWVSMMDVCPESAATVMALSNTIATIPGIVGQPITQAILMGAGGEQSQEAWSLAFGMGGAVSVCAAVVFAALGDDVSLDTPARPGDADKDKKSNGIEVSSF